MDQLSTKLHDGHFRELHPYVITDRSLIRGILDEVRRRRIELRRGMNRSITPETAYIIKFTDSGLLVRTEGFEFGSRDYLMLNFSLESSPYFMAPRVLARPQEDRVELALPERLYRKERRDRERRVPRKAESVTEVLLHPAASETVRASVEDVSPAGLGLRVSTHSDMRAGQEVSVQFLDGPSAGTESIARIRHLRECAGWRRVGVMTMPGKSGGAVPVENYGRIREESGFRRWQSGWEVFRAGARVSTARWLPWGKGHAKPSLRVVRYANDRGEDLTAIVDSCGDTRGAPALIIPPAWGRTKETLVALARTLVSTFRSAGEPVVVIRFDGIRRRGESYNDPECRIPGNEHHRFTFFQGVRDIEATARFLDCAPEFMPSRKVLITFSAASIEGRKAIARDRGQNFSGWISVVGSADLQSMMRVISGGVDFVGGTERGVEFGKQEILGIVVDIDYAGEDALREGIGFLDDSRRDFSAIEVPVTWLHGKYDAWMDRDRALDVLSVGDTSHRRFIELPTGHQLKSSTTALGVFQLVAEEASQMALGRKLEGRMPDLVDVDARQRAERARRPKEEVNLHDFWHRYLLGRGSGPGIELMARTSAYRELMDAQISSLRLESGDRVADLGCGTGAFPRRLIEHGEGFGLKVYEIDFVRAALRWARANLPNEGTKKSVDSFFIEANLDSGGRGGWVPLQSGCVDAVLGSLLFSYVQEPRILLGEIRRILRSQGRLVLSTLKKDADISRLFMQGREELRDGVSDSELVASETELDESARSFLNEAARLLDLEEMGFFRFWDADELSRLLRAAGFSGVRVAPALGNPAQAVIVTARRL